MLTAGFVGTVGLAAPCAAFAATPASAKAPSAPPAEETKKATSPASTTRERTEAAEHDPPLRPGDDARPTPEYGGRQPARSDAEEALLWVPRVLLFPPYVVSEFVVRRPLVALITLAERDRWEAHWNEFFTFGTEQKIGLFPTGRIDLGFRPTIGFYFYWQDIVGSSDVKLRVTTGGLDAWTVNTLWRVPVGKADRLRWTFDYLRRPDRTFYGLGGDVQDDATRYLETRLDGRLTYALRKGVYSFFGYAGLLSVEFDPDHGDLGDRSLQSAIDEGLLEAPPALAGGILALYTGIAGRVDTRPPRIGPPPRSVEQVLPRSGSGFAAGAHAEHNAGLERTQATRADTPRLPHWVRYGAGALGALDLTGTRRILDLEGVVEFAEPLPGDNPVPFTEQVTLGGSYPLRAFRSGRLVDLSAAVTTLTYRWPIWDYLDGNLHYAVGNVFGRHLKGFELERLRSSFGIGIASVGSTDQQFDILVAFGTKPFEDGAAVDSVRFIFGTRARF